MQKMFNESEIKTIMSTFPIINMKCCYDNIAKSHNDDNISNFDFYTAIPVGKKYIIWFTSYNNKKACFLLVFATHNNGIGTGNINCIDNMYKRVRFIKKIFVPFTNELMNSVFYGTNFYIKEKQNSYIALEDILYYKERDVSRITEMEKMNMFQELFNNNNFKLPTVTAYSRYNNNICSNNIVGLPIINKDKQSLLAEIESLPYKIDFIICKNFNDNNENIVKIKHTYTTEETDTNINTKETMVNHNVVENVMKPKVNIFDIINKVPTKKPPNSFDARSNTQHNQHTQHTQHSQHSQYTQHSQHSQYTPHRQHTQTNKFNSNNTSTMNKLNNEYVFVVKPDIQNDIYNLYTLDDNNTEKYYNVAYIPNYNVSVMMNKLFRNIKENENLDRLEESDDEDEFENNNIDKFVYLEKSYPMNCKYNYKFKKWMPISLAKKDAKVVNSSSL